MALLPGVLRRLAEPRPKTAERGYDSKWQTYSKDFLAKHPFCADPYKRHQGIVRSQVTDHIEAHRLYTALLTGDPVLIKHAQHLFWSTSNHQALCADCNRIKNIKEEGGFASNKAK